MRLHKNKPFWITGTAVALIFSVLFMMRLDLFEKLFSRPKILSISPINSLHEKETWMNIFQSNRKIGFSHSILTTENDGYRLQETVLMRINTMGMVQDMHLRTRGKLKTDFSLADFDFTISSGRFSFNVKGSVSGDILAIQTGGSSRKLEITFQTKPYLPAGITAALAASELKIGDQYMFDIFDPATLGQSPVIVEVLGIENISILGDNKTATKVALNFKGTSQLVWIGETGDVLQQKGILGIRLEKTSRDDAYQGSAVKSSADLTRLASVASNIVLENPDRLSVLKVEISGIPLKRVTLDGGRQTFEDRILTVEKESLANLAAELSRNHLKTLEKIFLRPTPFVQSDHKKIRTLAQKLVTNHTAPLDKVRALVGWVHHNIEKRPVLSLPDALSTLENRMGDCNEHAVLLAALARAVGIPCRIEAGLVYLKERFFYHAWNLVYLGRWITVDALFDQVPADVSHIRFVIGSPRQQLDLMGVIGQVKLKIIEHITAIP